MKLILTVPALLSAAGINAVADPQISSWFTLDSGKVARIYRTDADKQSDRAAATWSNGRQIQQQPACSGVQEVLSSADWIYVRSTGLGSHVMGPWYIDPQHRLLFPNLPTDQHLLLRLPRHPAVAQGGFQPLGEIGLFVDGVRMFDANDAFSYATGAGRDADPRAGIGHGDHIWNRDAFVNEGRTFDAALGHQQNWGRYHYHAEPLALRYLLGDHVDFDPATKTYHESPAPVRRHSPILGWMHDGFPIYGPYGYANPADPGSGIRRMLSGFVPRNGQSGTDDLAQSGRRTLPAWTARETHRPAALAPDAFGPNVSASYPIGHYIEDYSYLGDLGKTAGRDFDLDECNGRWCVTPEFPQGTYAYFTTIDAAGNPVYPYTMGRRFHGNPTGRLVNVIPEPVTTNFVAQPLPPSQAGHAPPATTLTWTADHGGRYEPNEK